MSEKRKKKMVRIVSLLLLVAMLVTTVASISVYGLDVKYKDADGKTITLSDFRDTQGHWAQPTILRWGEYNIVGGYNGNFMPNSPVKRGDLAIMLDRLMGLETMSYNYFTDLPTDSYYRDAVLKAVAEGYFSGTGNNEVKPENYATREEVAVILARAFNFDTSKSGYIPVQDNHMIASWARPSIQALYDLGYMKGDGTNMNPKSPVTRAEIITLFNNIAEMYIPEKSSTQSGNIFTNTVKNNVVIARSGIELVRSVVGRDVILTQSSRSFTISNTTVDGSLISLGRGSITINNSTIDRIELHGKTSLNGVNENIGEIIIKNFATESTLDKIPKVLYLEPGVRVRVENVMYENIENRTKKYTELEIKADIANEQGFVAGGPKVRADKFVLGVDNTFEFKAVTITQGQQIIKEAGVVIADGTKVPSIQDNDGKVVYKGRYDRPIDFTAGVAKNEMTYRFYAIDEEGFIGYGTPITVQEYDFSTELTIYDLNYPESIRIEVILKGDNIPEISSIRIPYGNTEVYSEQLKMVNLAEQKDIYADKNDTLDGFKRYVGELRVSKEIINGESVFNPPTFFGYIFTFGNGNIVRKFPVLSNAIPEGIAPVETISTGYASFGTNNRLTIMSNRLTTRHIAIQEAGVVYKVVPVDTPIFEPNIDWERQPTYLNIGLRETAYYNTTLTNIAQEGETHFSSYIKTANGYYYGNVKVVRNNWEGSEDGPKILSTPKVLVLSDTQALVEVPIEIKSSIDINKYGSIVSFKDRDGRSITKYDGTSLKNMDVFVNQNSSRLYIFVETLTTNTVYDVVLQLHDVGGNVSNIVSFEVNTRNKEVMSLTNKSETTSKTYYDFIVSPELSNVEIQSVAVMNEGYKVYMESVYPNWKLVMNTVGNEEKIVAITGKYYAARQIGSIKSYTFTRYFTIN